ncbi:MAG: hypothetical protein QM698_05060 [Micropepsaceae bacterium]
MASFMMVTPPAEGPVAVAELRPFLRVSHEAEDGLIARLGRAAGSRVSEETGRALTAETWRMAADAGEGRIKGAFRIFALRRPPYLSFIEARVAKDDGTSVALPLSHVRVDADGNAVWLKLEGFMADARAWRPVEVVWRAGVEDPAGVPEALRTAVMLLTAAMYERRDAMGAPVAALPDEVAALIAPFRVLKL